jgi:hypothetical protein
MFTKEMELILIYLNKPNKEVHILSDFHFYY